MVVIQNGDGRGRVVGGRVGAETPPPPPPTGAGHAQNMGLGLIPLGSAPFCEKIPQAPSSGVFPCVTHRLWVWVWGVGVGVGVDSHTCPCCPPNMFSDLPA